MYKSVIVISETGRLIDVTGITKESDAHYLKFAKRLLGESGTYATLDYGWSGNTKLKITGANGQEIRLEAQEVNIPGTLIVNDVPIQDIINDRIDVELSGLQGTQGEITLTTIDNESSDSSQPRKIIAISLSRDIISRIRSVENQIAGMFAFDEIYYAGDGLITQNDPVRNTINVFLGTGLKFESKSYAEIIGSGSTPATLIKPAVSVDCETSPVQYSLKPITAGAVFDAINKGGSGSGIPVQRYVLSIESTTGNIALYDTFDSLSSSSSSSS